MCASDGKTRAQEIIKNFVTANPEKRYLLDRFNTGLADMGNLALEENYFETARLAYATDREINEIILKAEPNNDKWRRRLSISYENCGDLFREQGDASRAKVFFEKSISHMVKINVPTQETRCELASLYGKSMYVAVMNDEYDEFYKAANSALKTLRLADDLGDLTLTNQKLLTLLTTMTSKYSSQKT